MKAIELHCRDQSVREKLGWGPMAFIGPKLPEPKTEVEQIARDALSEWCKNNLTIGAMPYQLHIYDVVELMERAIEEDRAE